MQDIITSYTIGANMILASLVATFHLPCLHSVLCHVIDPNMICIIHTSDILGAGIKWLKIENRSINDFFVFY